VLILKAFQVCHPRYLERLMLWMFVYVYANTHILWISHIQCEIGVSGYICWRLEGWEGLLWHGFGRKCIYVCFIMGLCTFVFLCVQTV
jgi:hypothetical protein